MSNSSFRVRHRVLFPSHSAAIQVKKNMTVIFLIRKGIKVFRVNKKSNFLNYFLNYPISEIFKAFAFNSQEGLISETEKKTSKTKFLYFSKLQHRLLQLKKFNQVKNDPRSCHL